MKAYLKNYRQSPRKVRLVVDLVRGKVVADALVELSFLPKRASSAISKLISSAAANAENNFKMDVASLFVKEITVDQGATLKRMRPRARGMSSKINKRTSNVAVTLAPKEAKVDKDAKKDTKKIVKKTAPRKVAKKAIVKKVVKKKITKSSK